MMRAAKKHRHLQYMPDDGLTLRIRIDIGFTFYVTL